MLLRLNKFLGLGTAVSRNDRSQESLEGFLDDVKNFVPNVETGAMTMRAGTSADVSGNATDISTATVVTTFDDFRYLSTEVPTQTDILVLCGRTAGGAKKIFQKPFFFNSATATNSYVDWKETKTTTINGAPSGATLVLAAGSGTDDYYNGWVIVNSTRSESLFVTDYAQSILTVFTKENVPSDWASGDTVTLYRFFHDHPQFTTDLTYTHSGSDYPDPANPPAFFDQGGSILFSGGKSSTLSGTRGVWSGYINHTLFTGATKTLTYQGTYVTEAEIKSLDSNRAAAGYSLGNASEAAGAAPGLDQTVRWFYAIAFRTEDGQMTTLLVPSTNYIQPSAADKELNFVVTMYSNINKRFRYMDVFMGKAQTATATALDWSEYFLIESHDLADSGWTYNESGAAPGNWTRTFDLDINDWNAVGDNNTETPSALDYLGYPEHTAQGVSFSQVTSVADRIFIANYYHWGTGLSYSDQILYSSFSGDGVPQFNVLPDIPQITQSTIEQGDSQVIKALLSYNGNLVVLKDNSMYSISIAPDSTNWQLNKVSDRIGCDAPRTAFVTPYGIIFAKSGDDVYLWNGGQPRGLTANWLTTFRNIATTYKASWLGWYNNYEKSYNLMITTDGTTKTTHYNAFFEYRVPSVNGGEVPAWFKQVNAANISQVSLGYDGTVRFVSSTNVITKFASTALDDSGTSISPYFKLGAYAVDENKILWFTGWYLINDQDGSGTWANNLDIKTYVDGTSIGSFTSLTKTKTRLASGLPAAGALGTTFDLEYNTNGTPATFEASSATATPLTEYEIGIEYELLPRIGDLSQSL